MDIPDLDRSDFQILLENENFPFLVHFYASWCETCRLQEETLRKLNRKLGGVVIIGKIDMDRNPLVAAKNMILSVPTTLIFHNGELLGRLEGYAGEARMLSFVEESAGAVLN